MLSVCRSKFIHSEKHEGVLALPLLVCFQSVFWGSQQKLQEEIDRALAAILPLFGRASVRWQVLSLSELLICKIVKRLPGDRGCLED
jgi:hypothetical protein